MVSAVDAAIFTGATHHLAVQPPLLSDALSLYPAGLDPQFTVLPDPEYLTTRPGTQQGIFPAPAPADPAAVAFDETHKDLMTSSEVDSFPAALAAPLDSRVPVLSVLGSADPLFCAASATDCSGASAMTAQEALHLASALPQADQPRTPPRIRPRLAQPCQL